ncbi:uncharacterized protein M6B38_284125 [Iris pallida]|uniref:Uncharacterized protein n=1 Tax=Iris pallida TaxID=29817 RepID=A0AAX6I1L4_IRIPA|nr:uncharacterized protein M6B38_284125 [Iris pallida]
MPQAPLLCCKYSYIHHDQKGLSQAIDIHDISIPKNIVRVLISYLGALLFLAGSFYLLLMKSRL